MHYLSNREPFERIERAWEGISEMIQEGLLTGSPGIPGVPLGPDGPIFPWWEIIDNETSMKSYQSIFSESKIIKTLIDQFRLNEPHHGFWQLLLVDMVLS